MAAVKPLQVNVDTVMDSIPRLRWSPKNHRFHYNMPIAAEPGDRGFVLMQEFEHADSFGTWVLPPSERHHLEEMERVNHMIEDVEAAAHLHDAIRHLEKKRSHQEEYHEHIETDEERKPNVTKRKEVFRQKNSPKHSYDARKIKPSRVGRVHQPR